MQPAGSLADRLRWAFSPRRTWRALLASPPERLRPVDGLRALSVLWVVVFHTGWHSVGAIPLATYFELLGAPWMLPIWRGAFGVDVFFVISGFLIAGMLLDERRETGRVALGLFYVRRLLRLWPAMALAVALDTRFTCGRPGVAWANLLYVSNFRPMAEVCAGWTWSLAIEEQFYLVCPWLLVALAPMHTRARMAALAIGMLALAVVGAYVVWDGGFRAFDAEIVVTRPLHVWLRAFDALYSKPWMRAGPLLAGVGAAFLYRSPRLMDAIARSAWRGSCVLLLALAGALAATHWPLADGAPRPIEVAFLASYRTVFGLAIATLLLFALSAHGVGRVLGRFLAWRGFAPIAQLAYAAYLVNPIAVVFSHAALMPLFRDGTVAPMPVLLPADLALTFFAALVVYLTLERPIMDLRPRAHPRPIDAGSSRGAPA
jgi:peptidoglycan/LPS O-acetylase OafA/YrhL